MSWPDPDFVTALSRSLTGVLRLVGLVLLMVGAWLLVLVSVGWLWARL